MNAISDQERSALVRVSVEKWDADQRELCEDDVAEEVPSRWNTTASRTR
jgi:FdhD protein